MPEYDAFGREIGEDTLSGLVSEPVVQPSTPQRAKFTIPTGRLPGSRKRRRRAGALIAFVILATVVAVPIFAVVSVVHTASDAVDSFDAVIPDEDQPVPDEPSAMPAKPPVGLAGASLIRPAKLTHALKQLRAAQLGRITQLDVRPEVINAQFLTRVGKLRSVRLSFDGTLDKGTLSGRGFKSATIPYGAIDVRAPERLVRRSAERYHRRPRNINYLIASIFPGEPHHWAAYFKQGTIVQGDRNGHVVRLISR